MDWLNGTDPYSGLSVPVKEFPPLVGLDDVTAGLSPSEVGLGLNGEGEAVTVDLDSESPHILVSAPTGRGKSAIARSVAVQRLAQGDLVVVLDVKRHSHRWAQKLAPNVLYCKSAQEVGRALVNLGRELHKRNVIADEHEGPLSDAPVGPRIVVVFEEMNASMTALKALDKRVPEGSYTAGQALMDISFMGRAVKMHLVSFAQLASFRASGGAEVIENYGTRILLGHSVQAWRWLASDCGKNVPAPEEKGRGLVCRGGKARETQFAWIGESESVDRVLSSVPAQRMARRLSGSRQALPEIWRQALQR